MKPEPPAPIEPSSRDFFFDTVTVGDFALAGRLDILIHRYGTRARITAEVLNEVLEGILAGYAALRVVETAANEGKLATTGVMTLDVRAIYSELLRSLGPGEASCIACASIRGGTVVTDDRAARGLCADRDVPFTGTIGILKACVQEGSLGGDEADAALQAMIDSGYFSPVRRISDLV